VDRAKSGQGLVSAITPNGIDFVSNKQTTLPGSELLVLQGIPTRRLHIGNETERELQDLAGNAMATTVIYSTKERVFITTKCLAYCEEYTRSNFSHRAEELSWRCNTAFGMHNINLQRQLNPSA
jgi:hypothetical protein